MVKEVVWTDEAIQTFYDIIKYLQTDWSEREVETFVCATDRVIDYITDRPRMFRKTSVTNVHEVLITPHNLLIYRVKPSSIELISFWDTRQNPKRKQY